MRIFALELNNEIKGMAEREAYIEGLISKLPHPELVVLPELALCSYMASEEIWKFADEGGLETTIWATKMAKKYDTYIAVGYLDFDCGDYYNRYMIAGKDGAFGVVTKSEGEAAVFKRGSFNSIIDTPFGKVGVGICYDSRRRRFYENVKDEAISLILFPHGAPADPKKPNEEIAANDYFCGAYRDAFDVPVVYVNSVGALEYMPGMMGRMMAEQGFRMNGRSKIYASAGEEILCDVDEAIGLDAELADKKITRQIPFYGEDIIKGNLLFRLLILKPDTKNGVRIYNSKTAKYKENSMNNVNKTLYIPLFGKSYVSKKNIILNDKMAEEIWDAEQFPLKGKAKSKWLAYYMGIRSATFDRWLGNMMESDKDATVIHIGCGMDSRITRVGNGGRPWYDIDFPTVIEARRKYYTQGDGYVMLAGDARDTGWLSEIPGESAILVMEGISMYLTGEELNRLFSAMGEKFKRVNILMDAYSEFAAKMSKIKNPINEVGVTQVWGIDDPAAVAEGSSVSYVGERDMTPDDMIDQLSGMEKKIFKKIYGGRMSKKLYKLYEYEKI